MAIARAISRLNALAKPEKLMISNPKNDINSCRKS